MKYDNRTARPTVTEYRHIVVENAMKSIWRDGLSAFGWTLEKCVPALSRQHRNSETMAELVFSRSREFPNRTELDGLQVQFENQAAQLVVAEQTGRGTAVAAACVLGLAGTALLAGAAFALYHGSVSVSAAAAIHSCAAWFLIRPLYDTIRHRCAVQSAPLMGRRYGAIRALCARADSVRSRRLAG